MITITIKRQEMCQMIEPWFTVNQSNYKIDVTDPYVVIPLEEYSKLCEVVECLEELDNLGIICLNSPAFSHLNYDFFNQEKVKIDTRK